MSLRLRLKSGSIFVFFISPSSKEIKDYGVHVLYFVFRKMILRKWQQTILRLCGRAVYVLTVVLFLYWIILYTYNLLYVTLIYDVSKRKIGFVDDIFFCEQFEKNISISMYAVHTFYFLFKINIIRREFVYTNTRIGDQLIFHIGFV